MNWWALISALLCAVCIGLILWNRLLVICIESLQSANSVLLRELEMRDAAHPEEFVQDIMQ